MEGRHSEYAIDLDRIVASRKGGDKLPRFVVNWLKRLVHQDFMNEFLTRGYKGEEFCYECLKYLDVKLEIEGLENLDLIPKGRHCTIASNHPLGGIDGVALIALLSKHFDGRVRLLANDFLMFIDGISSMCVPINKLGGQSRQLPAQIKAAYDSDCEMLMFPAGACSRKIDGRIQDYPWKKTFISQSVRSGRYVVPVHFIGENSKRFYRIATLCSKLGIKFNFAMFLLPDEMYRGQHQTVRIVIGKPLAPEFFDSTRSAYEWAQEVRNISYSL